jgi:Fur family transcriptional regulator, iron response regulator
MGAASGKGKKPAPVRLRNAKVVKGQTMDGGTEPGFGIEAKLRAAGLRPTRQRAHLARLLFGRGSRHVTAETLHAEAVSHRIAVSLATVYNTLNQFAECGLLREVAVEGSKTYFDTTITDHQHFFFEKDGTLMDLPAGEQATVTVPKLPEGMKIARVDVLIRLVPAT